MYTLPAPTTGAQSAWFEDGVRSLIHLCQRWLGAPPRADCPALDSVAEAPASDAESPGEPRPMGCGWFDSSHELQCGLRVQELSSVQFDAQALPLGVWLDLQTA